MSYSLTRNFLTNPLIRPAYRQAFSHPDTDAVMRRVLGLHQDQIPLWQKLVVSAAMPLMRRYIKGRIATDDTSAIEKARSEIDTVLREASNDFSLITVCACT